MNDIKIDFIQSLNYAESPDACAACAAAMVLAQGYSRVLMGTQGWYSRVLKGTRGHSRVRVCTRCYSRVQGNQIVLNAATALVCLGAVGAYPGQRVTDSTRGLLGGYSVQVRPQG